MSLRGVLAVLGLGFILVLSGCTVRTYPLTRDRIDQSLSDGNRGYLQGQPPAGSEKERKPDRTTQVFEIEIGSPFKMKKDKAACPEVSSKTEEAYTEGNQGYVTQSAIPETTENESVVSGGFEKYTVQKNDTLQKISKKFYGTTRKWTKIYDANKEFLKSPDRVRPGQVLNIPVTADFKSPEAMVEPRENLK